MKVVITAIAMSLGVLLIAASCGGDGCPCPTATPTYPTAAAPTTTPTPTDNPTSTTTTTEKTPTPTFTTQIADCIEIYRIKYNGIKEDESDEYVTIRNRCDENINLQGWVLQDITDGSPSFTFPFYILTAHLKVNVYTNEIYPNSFRFHWPEPIWNNSVPDTAALYDSKGRLISTKSYELNE